MSAAAVERRRQERRFAAVRERLAASPLVHGGGVLLGRLASAAELSSLRADALRAHSVAAEARVSTPDLPGGRGNPDRWLESAPAGPVQDAFARSTGVGRALQRATGLAWQLAGSGTWTYYRREGHHLGIHRDLAVCDLAVITCVINDGTRPGSGVLRVWPTRAGTPLDVLRRDPRGAVDLSVDAGQTVLLLGGVIAHRVLPLAPGHVRVVAPLCYRIVGEGDAEGAAGIAPAPFPGSGTV